MTNTLKFAFLDKEHKDTKFYKVLRPSLTAKTTVFHNIHFREQFNYKLNKWYTNENAKLDHSTSGVGFYAWNDLPAIIRQYNSQLRDILSGHYSLHPVELKEICGEDRGNFRARKIRILPPLSRNDIIQLLVGDETDPEEIISQYKHHKQELNRFAPVVSLLDSIADADARKETLKKNQPLEKKYWKIYKKYKPFFEKLSISGKIFEALRIPHDLEIGKISHHRFSRYDRNEDFETAITKLTQAVSLIHDVARKQITSSKRLSTRLQTKVNTLKKEIIVDNTRVQTLLKTHSKLLTKLPDFDEQAFKNENTRNNSWMLRDVKRDTRRKYQFSLSHVTTGDIIEVPIDIESK